MKNHKIYKTFRSFTQMGDAISPQTSDLIVETPLEIIINSESHIVIMFTPQMIRELVVGFVFTEGLISHITQIQECVISPVRNGDGGQLIEARVTISSDRTHPPAKTGKRVSYSSCGICGKEDYSNLELGLNRVKSRQRFSMDVLKGFSLRLQKLQPLYRRTGGAHAAVLFNTTGDPIFYSEDMGRHNALDKVIGSTLLKGISPEDKAVVSSGRASLEMILKAVRAGFPLFVAMSRPTSRAVEAAKFYNITLIDLAKDTNRIYSHARRIVGF
ncbi:MAG: formate dehydrogenase accessory sulfurtransferase FdhD [Desulfatiglandaceae bacterium]